MEIAPAMENGDLQSDYDYEYDDDEDDDDTWIRWFCSLKGNEFFCVVPDEFVFDNFNLTGLKDIVPHYNKALDIILDSESGMNVSFSFRSHSSFSPSCFTLYRVL